MESDHQPNPSRFEVFTELPNGKGFRIKNSKYIYLFDKFGGWYDEYNNYYNSQGEHEDPPIDEDEDFERVILAQEFDEHDDDDEFEREYGVHGHDEHEEDEGHSEHQKFLEAIAHNQTILHEYPVRTPLRVHFHNMSFKATKQDILKHFRAKLGNGILNVILTQENGKLTGDGCIICKEVSVAEKLVKYEGEEVFGRKASYDVENVNECLADPVTKQEMDVAINENDFVSLVKEKPQVEETKDEAKTGKKKYFAKTGEQPKEEIKPTTVKEPTQVVKKEENKQPTWSKYHGEVTMFPKKTSFKDWMNTLGFKENEHFKNPEKTDSKDPNDSSKRFATVELRSDVYDKIEGSLYEGKKVHFELVK